MPCKWLLPLANGNIPGSDSLNIAIIVPHLVSLLTLATLKLHFYQWFCAETTYGNAPLVPYTECYVWIFMGR